MPPSPQSLDFLDAFIPYARWRLRQIPKPDLEELMTKFTRFLESVGGQREDPLFMQFAGEMRTMIESGDVTTR
jgi:hypothetical protein